MPYDRQAVEDGVQIEDNRRGFGGTEVFSVVLVGYKCYLAFTCRIDGSYSSDNRILAS